EVHRRSLDSAPGRCGAHDVDFLLTHVVELPEKSTYSAEAFMLGEYRKHNTNGGFTMGPRQTPQSFSYFTFIKSGKRLMIVDIQGVGDLYTDPVIHFLPSKVSGALARTDDALNFALRGFALFLWSHRRNDIDQLLGLPVFGLSPHEEKYLAPSSTRTVKQLLEATRSKKEAGGNEVVAQAEEVSFRINLTEIPLVDLSDWCDWRLARPRRRRSISGGSLSSIDQEPGVEAECHLEIAAMYNAGRITLRSAGLGGWAHWAGLSGCI
ncbi:Eef2k, partial [Symbiodinium sp. CCMP2456]